MGAKHEIPKAYTDLVGTIQVFSGGLFSGKKGLPEAEYEVHDVRWGSAQVINFKELSETGKSSYCHPTVEFLLSNPRMKRKQWTRGFAVREINLKED
jgi:hypothetical protein